LHLEDEHGAFFLKSRRSTLKKFYTEGVEKDSVEIESKSPKEPFLLLHHGQWTKFDVTFKPTLAQRLEGKIPVLVGDKHSDKTLIELVGEGHKDEFTLDGLEEEERKARSSLKKDISDAVRMNHIQFGGCPVGEPCCRTFTITNRTCTKVMRFEWEADAPFQFSPKVSVDCSAFPHCSSPALVFLGAGRQPEDSLLSLACWALLSDSSLLCLQVVKMAPEPAHTVVEESSQEAEMYLSALVAYTQYGLSTVVVQLKDTLPFQTRTATFTMHNTGKVALEYSWEEAEDSEAERQPYSTAPMS
ncbi:HYDIN protein, partial [Sylvietta virens]|nr:HYDIN protein [Sylvietta virens]